MNSKDHKIETKKQARCNAAKKRNLHLKYIPLNDRRKNRSEPTLTKSKKNLEFLKTNRENVIKTRVITNDGLKKNPDRKKLPIIGKKAIDVRNVNYPNIQMKINDKLKNTNVRPTTKRVSIKRIQKIKPRAKQGGFTERIVSMWHYAKSFLGLSKSQQQNAQDCSMEIKRSKHNLPVNKTSVKPKGPFFVVKKPLIHHNNKDTKELKNVSVNQYYYKSEKNIEKSPSVLPISKIHHNNRLQHGNKSKVQDKPNNKKQNETEKLKFKVNARANEKEQIVAGKRIALKDKPKKETNKLLRHENKTVVQEKEQMVLKGGLKKDITVGINTKHENKFKNEETEADKQIMLNDKSKKDKIVPIIKNQSLQPEILTNVNVHEATEVEHQNVLKDGPKKNTSKLNVEINEKEELEAEPQIILKDKSDKINTNPSLQHENKEEIETEKQIVFKDEPKKGITLEINTSRSVCEIFTKTNSYKSTLNDKNATIIIEIKNASRNVQKDTKQIQPQTLNIHKNTKNCEKNVFTLLNTCKVKNNNITQIITRAPKVPINKMKKPSLKDKKIKRNLNKKKEPLVDEHKTNHKKSDKLLKKTQHEDTKKCDRRIRHKSCRRHHQSHQHGCRHHKIKHTKRRNCSICRGYISTDHSQTSETHHDHHKDKYDHKELCRVCNKRVTCLYHHTKKNHHDKNNLRCKYYKESKSVKKHSTTTKNKSTHNFQKKKRTLTVCTNSRRNSFKNKKLKRSVTYISTQIKPSTSKIVPKYKCTEINNSMSYSYVNDQSSDSSILRTDSDSDSDRQEANKVLSWWYLHYALNAVQLNEGPSHSNEIEENKPFLLPYGEFRNVFQAVSNVDFESDNSSNNENWNDDFEMANNIPRHPNSFTDEETMVSENIYPNSSIHNFEDLSNYDAGTSIETSVLNLEIPNNTPQKSTADLQAIDDK